MKKTLIALTVLLLTGLVCFSALGTIRFCTETDGDDALCFYDGAKLHWGTDRDMSFEYSSTLDAVALDGDTVNITHVDATYSGVLFIAQFTIAYTQTASYTICTIPANADVTKVEVVTTTAFTGGSATTIDVGYVGTLEAYASDLNIRTAGFATGDEYANLGDVGSSIVTMKAQITTDDTAGACRVYIYWTMGTPGTP